MNAHTPTPPVTATSTAALMGLLDPEANTDKADTLAIYDELIAACEPQPHTAEDGDKAGPTAIEAAAAEAYTATRRWMSFYEEHQADPTPTLRRKLDAARELMREHHVIHADEIEIEAIGALDDGRWIYAGYLGKGLAVYDDSGNDPIMYLPRGLGREVVLLILRTHDDAFAKGVRAGGNEVRAALAALSVPQ